MPIHNSTTPFKAAQPKMKATVIEVEDEDETKMNEKEKAKGPSILEDACEESEMEQPKEKEEKKGREEKEKGKEEKEKGKKEHKKGGEDTSAAVKLLQHLKQMKDRAMYTLRKWTARRRQDEVTISLFQALITAPINDAIRTLEDLRHPLQHVIQGLSNTKTNSTIIPAVLQTVDTAMKFTVDCLLDSGATGCYIDESLARELGLNLERLAHPIPVYNVDRTPNEAGPIRYVVPLRLKVGDHVETITFAVTNTGPNKIILGHSWLRRHNPNIDWTHAKVLFDRCPRECGTPQLWEEDENAIGGLVDDDEEGIEEGDTWENEEMDTLEEGERLFVLPEDVETICATYTISQHITEEEEHVKKLKANTPIPDRYIKYFGPIFEKSSFDTLPPRRKWDHAIELKDDSTPFTSKIYPLARDEQRQLDEFIEEHLSSGRIRPSKSPIASPFFFVKKKDGSLRPVQDYRRLNAGTIKNRYPLPLISEIIDKLRGARYFTKFDVRWGYNNVRIKEGDEWKAAFITNRGLFEPLVMFFGLTNSPATFQAMMNELFSGLIKRGVVIVYMDDILIFTKTLEEHRAVTKEVLQILADNGLSLKPEKCEWEKTKVEYLGLVISEDGVEMNSGKVEAVRTWPEPKDKHELQQFLGFANYYRRFINHFSTMSCPLHRLTGNQPWKWGEEERKAFKDLKMAVTTAPVLAFPTDNDPYRVEADSSGYATGATLLQCQDKVWKPIAFLSKSLNNIERNYEIYDREMLAIMRALEEWRHHLQGAEHTVEIHSDHKNLEYFMTAKKLNRRQARWSLELANYNFTLVHKPGHTMGRADALSRRPDHERGQDDNDGVILIEPHHLRRVDAEIEDEGDGLLEKIRHHRDMERVVKQKLALKEKEWEEYDGLILWQNRVYVPPDKALRETIIHLHHDTYATGHPGRYKTAELILRSYWWPRIHVDVRHYIDSCDLCQRTKAKRSKPQGLLSPNPIPTYPWQRITVDLITELPFSLGYDAIMMVVDRLTKMVRLIPTYTSLTSEGAARLYRDHVWKDFGLPESIISDRGTVFVSKFMEAVNNLLGIKTNVSTAYHPQTDGQTERVNQEVEQYLRIFVNYRQDDWADWLSLAEFSYNDKINKSTGHSPFMLNWGRDPRKGVEVRRQSRVEAATDFMERMEELRKEAAAALERAARDMKTQFDRSHQMEPEFKTGEEVLLEGENLKTNRPTRKFEHRRFGPFKVEKKIGQRAYRLKLPSTWKVHPVFHVSKLFPYHRGDRPHVDPPPPELVDGEPEQEVEEILNDRIRRGKKQFLVKWKGFPMEENEWLAEKDLTHAKRVLNKYKTRSKGGG